MPHNSTLVARKQSTSVYIFFNKISTQNTGSLNHVKNRQIYGGWNDIKKIINEASKWQAKTERSF